MRLLTTGTSRSHFTDPLLNAGHEWVSQVFEFLNAVCNFQCDTSYWPKVAFSRLVLLWLQFNLTAPFRSWCFSFCRLIPHSFGPDSVCKLQLVFNCLKLQNTCPSVFLMDAFVVVVVVVVVVSMAFIIIKCYFKTAVPWTLSSAFQKKQKQKKSQTLLASYGTM